jgi:hypothetical protein
MNHPPPDEEAPKHHFSSYGTILEAAFCDPAYQWPPPDGEGKNAIELQASITLLEDSDSVQTTDSDRARMEIPTKPEPVSKKGWSCCANNDAAMMTLQDYEVAKKKSLAARKEHYTAKKARAKAFRKENRYNRVPEGILIYRLDTSSQTLTLMSEPHSKTVVSDLVKEMVIASAKPSPDKSRRGMLVTGVDGHTVTLVACEQRTAIAWMEGIDLMLANKRRLGDNVSKNKHKRKPTSSSTCTLLLLLLLCSLCSFLPFSTLVPQDGISRMAQKQLDRTRARSD